MNGGTYQAEERDDAYWASVMHDEPMPDPEDAAYIQAPALRDEPTGLLGAPSLVLLRGGADGAEQDDHVGTVADPVPNGAAPTLAPDVDAAHKGGLADWASPIDWAEFWSTETPAQDWLIEPIVPAGRQVAIFSVAKTGKSLLALDAAAALATGRPVLGVRSGAGPQTVVYIDLEMTDDDVRERLEDLGYGPETDLSRLHYYVLPSLPSLDSDLGGQVVEAIALRCEARLVVVDTMARAVAGEENRSDTYRDFYQHTGRRLKAAKIALLRLDHAGKDGGAGQRGSSAKADDVDVVFQLTAGDEGFTLKRTHSRVPWVPAVVQFERRTDPLGHRLTSGLWPGGTKAVADDLDRYHVPLDATASQATRTLRESTGTGRRKTVVVAALKFRRQRQ